MHSLRKIKRPKRSYKLNMSDDNDDETSIGIRAPIVGYEVVDRREKFTVYKVQVRNDAKSWFVFRRYTDFVRLNDKLEDSFPGFHFKLPAKRWFKNNFDPDFIEERAHGLQFFINNILRHSTISKSQIVKEFLCLDDPPGPFDSLEESRAYCQQLEDEIEDVKEKMMDLTTELNATKSQLAQARVQQEALVQSLKLERALNSGRHTNSSSFKAISNGQERTGEQSGDDENQRSWMGNLEIATHSKSVNQIKPQPRKILTSTPEKDSHLDSFQTVNNLSKVTSESNVDKGNMTALGDLDDTLNNTVSETKDDQTDNSSGSSKEFENRNSDTNDELSDINGAHPGNLDKQQSSSKRDSGIVADTGLSPITT